MATKKSKKKTTYRRKRRVSGVGALDLQATGLAVLGALAAAKGVEKLMTNSNETVRKFAPYLGVAAGVVLPMIFKQPMVKPLALGLVAGGAIPALKELKVLKGVGMAYETISGYRPLPYRTTGRQANVVNGANWSGSGQRQAAVISGVNVGNIINQPASMVAMGY